ncbi:Ig-like domain-containing protein [Nocardia sp. CDC159]|uniref:Ig-like domain-containing protein n=1 Tax=Nocardia pulmonis TaxID=2951408 RepID=A0A9X2IXH1_9NOCA|nr:MULTISPECIES: Ig-like domain-containing protein [Nocardia]MCM6773845.1 Ig-like domain-containing protein [Nocardia pulmonis]MCM6786732.1 Ig-like domain-containing protein [Nocardia sp. CDC159]
MSGRRCRFGIATGFALVTMLLAACSSSSGTTPKPAPGTAGPAAPIITVTPGDGSKNVDPLGKIEVSASDGILTDVTMANEQGKPVEGILTPDRTAWKPTGPLGYNHTYTVTAQGISISGPTGPLKSSFATITPSNQTKVYLNTTLGQPLAEGGTYGVGTVIVAHFDEDIPDKAAAEKQLTVTTDPPVTGSWYWMDKRNAHWRPEKYWAPGTKVSVQAKLYGVQFGQGLYGQEDAKTSFVIGPSHVSIADDNTKHVQVFENGKLIRTMPTSMGRGGSEQVGNKTIYFNTPAGIYTVMDKGNPVIMDSSTYGLPVNSRLGYKETINWATRISGDGIYLHQLDSTVWAQGSQNLSHGCLNLNGENAKWFYNWSLPGDVVEIRNTTGPPQQSWNNGDWTIPWDEWQAGSALR